MPFSLNDLDNHVSKAVHPEEIQDILVHIFNKMKMRLTGSQVQAKKTGFEGVTLYELCLVCYHALNELVRQAY